MIEGDRFRLVGSHAQGLKSMRRGRGGSAAATATEASARSVRYRRDMARRARARAAAATMQTGLRARCRLRDQPPLTYFIPPYGLRVAMQMQPAASDSLHSEITSYE